MRSVLVALIGLILMQPVCMAGEQFRCGQWVVSQEVSVAELIKKCGEPTAKTRSTQDVFIPNGRGGVIRNGVTVTEVWTYERGSRSFPMIVTIIDGEIDSMSHSR